MARKVEREQKNAVILVIPFFFLLSPQLFSTNSRGNACYAGYLDLIVEVCQVLRKVKAAINIRGFLTILLNLVLVLA